MKVLKSIWLWILSILIISWAMVIMAISFTIFPGLVTYSNWYLTTFEGSALGGRMVGLMPSVVLMAGVGWSIKTMYNGIKLLKRNTDKKDEHTFD